MNSVFCRFLFVSLLKLGICSLIAMNCASFAIAQAVLNPNHIKGKVEFTNTNPLILEFFNTNYGANGFWNARVSASEDSRYHYTDTIYNSQWHSSTGSDYELTVESSAAGISYRIETSAFFEYWNDWYIFDAVQAAPVYPEPAPDTILNFRQCVGLLEMSWRDHAGNPVAVTGGQARAYRKKAEPPTEYWMPTHDLQALSWNFTNGAAKEYLPVRGDGGEYLVEVLYDLGADPYNDKIRRLCQKMVNVSCDQIVSIVCDVPPPTLLGQISGTVDMVGVNEQRLGDLTRLYLWNGPFNNHRYATVDSSPSSGSFTLKNLLPDLPGETENVVHAHMLLREGNEEEYFISPLAMASEVPALHAEPGKTKDLGDTFIMKPGYVTGSITLAGPPPESGGACLQHIYRETPEYYRTIPQPDIYIIGQTFVQAWGSGMRPSGSTLSSSGGFVRTKFPGSYNPQTANFEGSYNLILAGLKGEPSNWLFAELGLQFYTPSPDTIGEYIDSTVVISDNKIPQRDIYPGTTTQADRSYCMSEVRLSYRTLSGTIFGPAATLYGSFQGNDFQGKPADYQISWSYAANGRAEQAAQTWVTMCMPQGKYTVMPSVWAISPSGSMSQVSLPSFEVDIGCRQVIDLTTELQLSLGQLPQETSLETITLYGAANGSKNIARIFYTQNGSGEKTICSNCGDDPPFSTEITLNAGINEIVVTVVDAGGNRASAKAYITYNPVPDDGGSNPPDGEEICAGGKLLLCHYPPGNTGNPQSFIFYPPNLIRS
ncbi:MAG TPA: hypothetical protein PLP17_03690, partial [Oligoflexia bacterium]|nr:hypothetical protein [Oligoflexia bacterium]